MRIAAGETLADLTLSQEAIASRGAALQCRITTEDTVNGFRPDTGRIAVHRSPGDAGIRLDGGTQVGAEVSAHFDSMLVKMTCRGRDFATAVVGAVASAKSEQELSHEDEAVLAQPGGKRQAALNRLLFPGPSKDFEDHREKYSETAQLSDNRLFYALRHGEEHRVELEKGVELLIGLEAISDPDERGMRTVMCIMNGRLRPVAVRDRCIASGVHRMLLRSCCLRPDKSSLGRSDIRHTLLVTLHIRLLHIRGNLTNGLHQVTRRPAMDLLIRTPRRSPRLADFPWPSYRVRMRSASPGPLVDTRGVQSLPRGRSANRTSCGTSSMAAEIQAMSL